jgi:FAD/FMN-containing dehydrogenase
MSPITEVTAHVVPSFTGQLLRPTDDSYDDRRRVHNGLIDKRPAIIASCQGVADIVDAGSSIARHSCMRSRRPGVVGSTGIAGLTLCGGVGWLIKYGLALDNLRAVEMVTADG